jgi:superfamily II DNA or RNA helicase
MDPIQEEAVNCSMRDLKSLGGSVQNVACGTGKTRNASELIYNLGRRTLIVVPNELILKMWANDVFTETPQDQYDAQIDAETYERQKQGVTKRPWLFGVTATVLREKYEENPRNKRRKEQELAENADIVITTVQTLYSSMFPAHFLNRFGSIGFDEVHHLNKPKYSEVLQLLPMRYRFGISATAERRDGTSLALYYNVGPLSVFYERTEDLTGLRNMMHVVNIALTPPAPKYLLKSFTDLYAQFRRKLNKNENAMYALSNMAYLTADDPLRRHIIAVLIAYILHNNVRQKIVTFTEYCAQSLHLVEAIRQATGYEVPVLFSEVSVKDHWSRLRQLYGNMPEKPTRANKMEFQKRMYEAVNSKEYPVFVGTDKFLNEGFDCPDIDCVIFASDLKDVKQHLGRAQRPRPGKSIPLCIDVHCNFEPWTKRARDRRALYTHLG